MKVISIYIAALSLSLSAIAQDGSEPMFVNRETGETISVPTIDGDPQDRMAAMMDQQIKRMVSGMLEEQIRFLEVPENMRRIAKIARNYYKELVAAGFSEEEAILIVSNASLLPSVSNK